MVRIDSARAADRLAWGFGALANSSAVRVLGGGYAPTDCGVPDDDHLTRGCQEEQALLEETPTLAVPRNGRWVAHEVRAQRAQTRFVGPSHHVAWNGTRVWRGAFRSNRSAPALSSVGRFAR